MAFILYNLAEPFFFLGPKKRMAGSQGCPYMVLSIEVDKVEAAWGRGSLTKYFQNPGITEKGGGV